MATKPPAPASRPFTINLKINANGDVEVTGDDGQGNDFSNKMVVGDTARFVAADPNVMSLVLEFRSAAAVDRNNNPIPSNLLPFGVMSLENPDPATCFTVVHSCKSVMLVTIVTTDTRIHHCAWDPTAAVQGPGVCTGGGDKPARC